MKLLKIIAISVFAVLAGCASNPMTVSSTTTVQQPAQDEAQIVFMRDTFVGSAINASLYEVTDDDVIFIGIISNATKVPYKTTPGKHTFMVVSEAADFMESDVVGGKTYYSLVTPRMGAWKARFSLWPIESDPNAPYKLKSKEFESWKSNTKLATSSDKAKSWFDSNKASVIKKKNDYWPVWQKKSKGDLAKRTLSPEDGI